MSGGGATVRWGIVLLGEYPRGNCPDPMQDYKSARVAVIICAILVNTQTHTQREREFLTSYTTSSASWAKAVYKLSERSIYPTRLVTKNKSDGHYRH